VLGLEPELVLLTFRLPAASPAADERGMIVLDRVLGDFNEDKPSAAGREQRRRGAGMVQTAGCRAVPRARSGAARDLRRRGSRLAPRPVSGSLLLRKPYHPDEVVRAVRQLTGDPPA
jgi:hypothetical protein